MSRPFYTSADLNNYPDFKEYAPEAFEAYNAWSSAAFAEGALGKKTKELIAFAVAHAIQCPYCIDVHTKGSSAAGATREEMAEAVHVAAVIRGGASLVHAVQALQTLEDE
ncbi:MAG TPA: carboxymuconolactone decarboxylase family protein [Candidatus Limnocylindria bacterium]|nr:carboxymuconolactone decarboxylase family protein [Candidatus Limnocylindria bacterium]